MDLMGYFSDLCIQSPQTTPGEHLNFWCQISGCSAPVWIGIGGFSRFGCQKFSGRKFLETPGKEQDPQLPGTDIFAPRPGRL